MVGNNNGTTIVNGGNSAGQNSNNTINTTGSGTNNATTGTGVGTSNSSSTTPTTTTVGPSSSGATATVEGNIPQNNKNSTGGSDIRCSEWVTRVRGLPWTCTTEDIITFFEPVVHLTAEQVHIIREYDGRVSGQAFVEFPDESTRDVANSDLHKKHIGDRYIELYKASREELGCYLRRSQGVSLSAGNGAPAISTHGKEVVRLRGLPFSTTDAQVQRWFEEHGFNIELSSIAIGYYADGRMTGEAWILIEDKQEVISKLNKETMGRRYIEIFPSMVGEFEAAKMGSCPGPGYAGRGGPPMAPYGSYGGGYRGEFAYKDRGRGGGIEICKFMGHPICRRIWYGGVW